MGCLRSVQRAADEAAIEIIVVDNASTDKSVVSVKSQFKWVKIIENKQNLGFATALNQGIRESVTEFVLALNPDAMLVRDSLRRALDLTQLTPEVGVLGFQPMGAWGEAQPAAFRFPSLFREFWNFVPELKRFLTALRPLRLHESDRGKAQSKVAYTSEIRNVESVSGAAMLLRRSLWEKLGGFDERFFLYHEEIDYCTRVRAAGFRVICTNLQVIHLDAQASGYVPARMATNPVLSWRVLGMRYLWEKHRPGLVGAWVTLARMLLLIRVAILALAGIIGVRGREYVDKRTKELQELRRCLAEGAQ